MHSNHEAKFLPSNATECNILFHIEGYGEIPTVWKSVNKKNLQTNNVSAVQCKQYAFNIFWNLNQTWYSFVLVQSASNEAIIL